MAIRTPSLDYNQLGSAYARKENVQQYGIQTRQQELNIEETKRAHQNNSGGPNVQVKF